MLRAAGQPRHQRDETRCEHRGEHGDAEHPRVERDLVGAHRETRGIALEDPERGVAEAETEETAEERGDQRLDQDLTAQRLAVGAEGGAQRELVLAAREPR